MELPALQQTGFEFRFILIDWLPTRAIQSSLICYLIHASWGEIWNCTLSKYESECNELGMLITTILHTQPSNGNMVEKESLYLHCIRDFHNSKRCTDWFQQSTKMKNKSDKEKEKAIIKSFVDMSIKCPASDTVADFIDVT